MQRMHAVGWGWQRLSRVPVGSAAFGALAVTAQLALGAPITSAVLASTTAPEARPTVHVTVLGRPADLERIRTAADLGPETRWTLQEAAWDPGEVLGTAERTGALVRCWIDVSRGRRARLYFADAARERFLLRDVALPEGLSELGLEALAQVLEMSVTALLEEGEGMTRSEAARVLQADSAPAAADVGTPVEADLAPDAALERSGSGSSGLAAAPFYAVRAHGTEAPLAHGPGLALGWMNHWGDLAGGLWLSARYELEQTVTTPEVGVAWTTTALRGGVALLWSLGPSGVRAGGRIGAGVDLAHITPLSGTGDEPVTLTRDRVLAEPIVSAAAGVCAAVAARLGACAELFADLSPTRVRYALARGDARSDVFVPWRLRPGLALGLVLH